MAPAIKNPTANAGNEKDVGSVPELGPSPGGGHGNALQHSCWRIPWTEEPGGLHAVHGVAESDTTEAN